MESLTLEIRAIVDSCSADALPADDDVDLLAAGLLDSLSLVEVLESIEEHYGVDLLDLTSDVKQLCSIATIADLLRVATEPPTATR